LAFFVNYQDFKKNQKSFWGFGIFLGFGPILRNFEISLLLGPSIKKKISTQFFALNVVVSAHYNHKFGFWSFSLGIAKIPTFSKTVIPRTPIKIPVNTGIYRKKLNQ
jgi:hypothetical protein